MLYYISPYFFAIISSFFIYNSKQIKNISFGVLLLLLFPAMLVAILRGDVGIDTANYLGYFNDKINSIDSFQKYEPGFEFLSNIFVSLGFNARFSLAIIAFITSVLLSFSFSGSKEKVFFFFLIVFPSFYYDATMNGLRYGLSFSLMSFSYNYLKDNNKLKFIIVAISSVLIQFSSILLYVSLFINKFSIKRIFILLFGVFMLFFLFYDVIILFLMEYSDKKEVYNDLSSPGGLSGIIPLFIHLYISIVFILNSKVNSIDSTIYIIIFFEIISFILARFTYAGLRLQTLFLFSLFIYIAFNINNINENLKNRFFKYLIPFSFLIFLVFLRNINTTVEDVETPFLPYYFFWE